MLKNYVESLEGVAEQYHELYSPIETGGFVLETDDDSIKSLKSKVGEFRSNNITLARQRDELESKLKAYDGIDPNEIQEAMQARKKVEDAEFMPKTEVDKFLNQRIEAERTNYEQQLQDLTKARESLSSQLADMYIEKEITEALNKVGQLQKGALSDVLRRARLEIEVKDNQLVERESGISIDSMRWSQDLFKSCPYFFVPNTGVGARGSSEITGEVNPWKEGSVNLTEQGKLFRESPEKARQMAAEAGVTL